MQLKFIHLVFILFCFKVSSQAKSNKPYYLFFDDKGKCPSQIKQFEKHTNRSTKKVHFIVRDCHTGTVEMFKQIGDNNPVKLDNRLLSKFEFNKIEELNAINNSERKAFFDATVNRKTFKSTFIENSIYIIKKEKGELLKYKVSWESRVLDLSTED